MAFNRRDFLKSAAVASAASAVGISVPTEVEAQLKRLKRIGDGIRLHVGFVELGVELCLQPKMGRLLQ